MSRMQIDVPVVGHLDVAAATQAFVQKVFVWMAAGLALTGIVAAALAANEELVKQLVTSGVFFGILIGELALVMVISWGIRRISAGTATALYVFYAALNGVTFAVIFLVYTGASIAMTFFVTAGTFGAMAVYGYVTKRDLTGLGSLMFMGLIGFLIGTVVNLFVASQALHWLLTYAGIVIFIGLTAYDTQKIKMMARMGLAGAAQQKAAILGALALYLDFINLFLLLLRLFGRRR